MASFVDPALADKILIERARKFLQLMDEYWLDEKVRTESPQLVHRRTGRIPKVHREFSGGIFNIIEAKVDLAKILEEDQPNAEEVRTFFASLRNRVPL